MFSTDVDFDDTRNHDGSRTTLVALAERENAPEYQAWNAAAIRLARLVATLRNWATAGAGIDRSKLAMLESNTLSAGREEQAAREALFVVMRSWIEG